MGKGFIVLCSAARAGLKGGNSHEDIQSSSRCWFLERSQQVDTLVNHDDNSDVGMTMMVVMGIQEMKEKDKEKKGEESVMGSPLQGPLPDQTVTTR